MPAFASTTNIELIKKLRKFVDKNPKIDINGEDCELVVFDKGNNSSDEGFLDDYVYMRFAHDLPDQRNELHGTQLFFYHGGAAFMLKQALHFSYNINRELK